MDEQTKIILIAILEEFAQHVWYINSSGKRMPMIITERYREDAVSGVVFGNVSGGSWPVDDLPMGPLPHGIPYWLPRIDPALLEELKPTPPVEEKFGEVEVTIGNVTRKAIATPSR